MTGDLAKRGDLDIKMCTKGKPCKDIGYCVLSISPQNSCVESLTSILMGTLWRMRSLDSSHQVWGPGSSWSRQRKNSRTDTEETSRSTFVNAKQNDRKAKVLSSDGRGQAREAEPVGRQRVCGQRCQSWETGLCVINFINL
jgi:hypothetical protein